MKIWNAHYATSMRRPGKSLGLNTPGNDREKPAASRSELALAVRAVLLCAIVTRSSAGNRERENHARDTPCLPS